MSARNAAGADLRFVTYRTDGFNLVKTGDDYTLVAALDEGGA
jgi:hypothetical protein